MNPTATATSQFRAMLEADLTPVMAIEGAAYSHPWSPGIFRDCINAGYTCMLMLLDDVAIGHAVMSTAVGEAHILNICVHPDYQGRGLGRRFLEHLLNVAVQKSADTAFLEVRASNKSALSLYDSIGFNEIGVRPGYYPCNDGREDAIIFALNLV